MVYKEQSLSAEDGVQLNTYRWLPKHPKAALVLSHGWSEHAGRYHNVAQWFAMNGYQVHALDHRGHGKSDGIRGHVDCWTDYARDLESLRQTIELDVQYLLGHSMGGMISVLHLLKYPESFRAVALTGPAMDVSYAVPRIKVWLSKCMSSLAPTLRFKGDVDPAMVCGSEAVVTDYLNDPLNHGKVSARWFVKYLKLIEEVKASVNSISVPLAIWHGEGDSLVEPWVSQNFFESLPGPAKRHQLVEGALHEVLFEDDWEQTASEILDWIALH